MKRFRPTLSQYRELLERYDTAKVNLDIACSGVKFYKEAIDTQNKDLCKALEKNNELAKAFHTADEYAVKMESRWVDTASLALLLSIVVIACSAYQLAQW